MTYLLATYWLPLLLALLLGGAVGFFTFSRPARGWWPQSWPNWLKLLGAAFIVGVIVAWLAWLPGYAGHYLETALLLLAAYIVGCFAGSWFASLAGAAEEAPAKPIDTAPATTTAEATATTTAEAAEDDGEEPSLENHPGLRPAALAERTGEPDDLKIISGIGPKNERLLHRLGIFYFRQIAEWNDDNIQWVDSYLKFKGRIQREDWVGQAKQLAREKT